MYDLTVAKIWKGIHYGAYIYMQEIYWCVIDDENIKKHRFVWSRDPSKRSEPATERGSFVSVLNEWYALVVSTSTANTTNLIRMALNNNCGLKC